MTRKRGKIKPKTKSESSHKSEDEIIYCICRSSDGSRFMIACDNCEEWYHGDCINVTPKQANNIRKFFCHLCIGRNPALEIEYKTHKESTTTTNRVRAPNLRQQIKKINFSSDEDDDYENDGGGADLSSSSTPDKSFASVKSNKRSVRKRSRNSLSHEVITKSNITPAISVAKKKRGRPREKQDEYDEEATEDEVETSGFAPPINDCNPIGIVDESDSNTTTNTNNNSIFGNKKANYGRRHIRSSNFDNKPCGVCDGCKAPSCGKCDICAKYSSGIISKFSCRRKVCLRSSRPLYQYQSRYDEDIDTIMDDRNFVRQNNTSDYDIREIRQRILNPDASKMQHNQGILNNNSGIVSRNNPGLGGTCLGSKMRRGDHLPGGNNHSRRGNSSSISMNLKYYDDESPITQQCSGIDMSNGGGVLSANYHQHPNIGYRYQQTHYSSNNTISRLSKNSNQSNSIVPPHPQISNYNNRRARNSNTESSILNNNSNTAAAINIASDNMYEDSDEDVMIPAEFTSGVSNRRNLSENDNRHYLNMMNLSNKHNRNHNVYTENSKQNYGLNYPDHMYCKHHRYISWQQYNMGVPLVNSISASAASNISSDLVPSNKAGLVPMASTTSTEEIIDFPSTNTPTGGPGTSPATNIDDISTTYMLLDAASTPQSHSRSKYKHSSTINCTSTNTTHMSSDPSFTVFSTNTPPNMSVPPDSSIYSIVDLNPISNSIGNSASHHTLTSAASLYTVGSDKFSNNSSTQKNNAQNTSQEFYTINDDDSLEINWPKETVNAS